MRGPPKRSLSFWALGDARQEASCHGHPPVPGPRLESLRVESRDPFGLLRRGDGGLLFEMKSAQGMFRIDSRWVVIFGWIFGPGALFWSGSGTWISADPKTPRAYRDDKSLASCFRVKGVRQARQTTTRLSRIQANARLRVVGGRSWRFRLCPPTPPFSPRDVGLPATGSWRAKESSGSGSVQSDIDISTSLRCRVRL